MSKYGVFSGLYFPTFGLNTGQKNSVFGYFLCSVTILRKIWEIHIPSKFQCGFRTGFSVQHSLIYMNEKLRKWECKMQSMFSSHWPFTDFWMYRLQPPNSRIAWLWVHRNSKTFISWCLSKRKIKIKINFSYITYENIVYVVPQGSITEPPLFNIQFVSSMKIMSKILHLTSPIVILIPSLPNIWLQSC